MSINEEERRNWRSFGYLTPTFESNNHYCTYGINVPVNVYMAFLKIMASCFVQSYHGWYGWREELLYYLYKKQCVTEFKNTCMPGSGVKLCMKTPCCTRSPMNFTPKSYFKVTNNFVKSHEIIRIPLLYTLINNYSKI